MSLDMINFMFGLNVVIFVNFVNIIIFLENFIL